MCERVTVLNQRVCFHSYVDVQYKPASSWADDEDEDEDDERVHGTTAQV